MIKTAISIFLLCMFISCRAQESSNSQQQCQTTPLTTSSNNFGSLLTNSLEDHGNIFISPLSIYTALAMTYLGARGNTAVQMEEAFQLASNNLTKEQFHQSFKELLDLIKDNTNEEYKLLLANGIFMQQNFDVRHEYIEDTQRLYRAAVKTLDFLTKGEEAKNEINTFVAEYTQDKIPTFLQEPLSPDTVLALLNAVYFKGTWLKQFPQDGSHNGSFFLADGSSSKVPYMSIVNEKFPYYEDPVSTYRFLQLPYKGDHISMLLALPPSSQKVTPSLNMTSDFLCHVSSKLRPTKLSTIMIPKFSLKYRKELVEVLQKLGIHDLFNTNADLSGISENGNLQVSSVIHEAVVDVNEEGSEAAAVTGVFITRMSIPFNDFIANRPFLFYIVDKRNGLVLFSGRVSNP